MPRSNTPDPTLDAIAEPLDRAYRDAFGLIVAVATDALIAIRRAETAWWAAGAGSDQAVRADQANEQAQRLMRQTIDEQLVDLLNQTVDMTLHAERAQVRKAARAAARQATAASKLVEVETAGGKAG